MTYHDQKSYEKRVPGDTRRRYNQRNELSNNDYNAYSPISENADRDPYGPQSVAYTGYAPRWQPYQGQPVAQGDSTPYLTQRNRQFKQPLLESVQAAQPAQRPPATAERLKPSVKQSAQQSKVIPKRSKAESLALVSKLKRWSVAASILSFGTLSVLAAGHVTGITSSASATATSKTTTHATTSTSKSYLKQTTSSSTSQATATPTQSTTTTTNQGGYGFGSSTSTQSPVTSSSTS